MLLLWYFILQRIEEHRNKARYSSQYSHIFHHENYKAEVSIKLDSTTSEIEKWFIN